MGGLIVQFGKFIQSQQAEWGGACYLNYKGLKKIINSIEKDRAAKGDAYKSVPSGVSIEHPSHELYPYKTAFFFKLERELEKINTFYLQKENDFKIRLASLLDKKKMLFSSKSKRAAVSLMNLKEALTQFRLDLTKLQNYVEVNATGFRKILKKWDKRSKSSTKEIYLSRQVEIQPCFNRDVLTELTDAATMCMSDIDQLLEKEEADVVHGQKEEGVELEHLEHTLIEAILSHQPTQTLVNKCVELLSSASCSDADVLSRVFLRTCAEGSLASLIPLLESGHVNVSFSDDISDRTSIHCVAIVGKSDILQLVLTHPTFKWGVVDVYGRHPMHYIGMYGHTDCARMMFQHQPQHWDTVDHDGCTPLVHAIMGRHTTCADVLIQQGASVEPALSSSPIPLCLACQYGQLSIAHVLIQKGAQVNVPNADGLYPLHLTSRYGHAALTRLLLDHGANVECKDTFNVWTPLFFSASEGHLENTRVLLAAGAERHVKDEYHWLPWTYALYKGHIAVAECVSIQDLDVSQWVDTVASPSLPCGSPQYQPSLPTTTAIENLKPQSTVFSVSNPMKPMAPSTMFTAPSSQLPAAEKDLDTALDDIPTLSLPPPIIPFRIYGHNYLDSKWFVQIKFETSVTCIAQKELKSAPICSTPFFAQPLRKKMLFEDMPESGISIFGHQHLSTFKLLISSKPDVGIPYSVILPIEDETDVFTFLVDESDIKSFMLQFDIYPTFGTKVIGRAVASPDMLGIRSMLHNRDVVDSRRNSCPLLDTHLRVVGEIGFQCNLVKPFKHPCLTIGGVIQTYWKSTLTKIVDPPLSSSHVTPASAHASVQRFVTASSLLEEYVYICVHVTLDHVPAVYDKGTIQLDGPVPVKMAVSSVTLDQLQTLVQTTDKRKHVIKDKLAKPTVDVSGISALLAGSCLSLLQVLQILPSDIGLCIQVCYPDKENYGQNVLVQPGWTHINKTVDAVLEAVYDSSQLQQVKTPSRSIIFASCHPNVCTSLNWKQPNYGVFFKTYAGFHSSEDLINTSDARCTSIKSAIKFAKSNNLLGLMCEAEPLVKMPILIPTIKESGLILASFGHCNSRSQHIKVQHKLGVDALVCDGLFRYTTVT